MDPSGLNEPKWTELDSGGSNWTKKT